MREHILQRRQRVPVSVERAFEFYAAAVNLEPMTPPWLHFRVTTPGPIAMGVGTLLDYRLRLHGFPIRWQTRIETWEPPLRFSDTQVRGPYSLWEHTHVFEPQGGRACAVHDRVRYAIPYGLLGELAHGLFVRRDLERIFDFRRDALAAHFSTAS
jgi:ligand-binding SRPBCC domain-containing protein